MSQLLTIITLGSLLISDDGKVNMIGTLEIAKDTPVLVSAHKFLTAQSELKVEFAPGAVVTNGKKKVDVGTLTSGTHLRVIGRKQGETLQVENAEVLDAAEGTVTSIMETFPLRLQVQTKTALIMVQLEDETKVFRDKELSEAGKLREGQRILVYGTKRPEFITAFEIRVVTAKAKPTENLNRKK